VHSVKDPRPSKQTKFFNSNGFNSLSHIPNFSRAEAQGQKLRVDVKEWLTKAT
jgi:hypothetical protein